MLLLSEHPYFDEYADAQSGVKSYILTHKPTPIVQSFYFVNQSLSADQRHLWMYCATPPIKHRTLGVVGMNPDKPFIKHFHHAVFTDIHASPLVAEDGESVYFASDRYIYQLYLDGSIDKLGEIPRDYIRGRKFGWVSTHLTISSDKKYMLLDGECGGVYFVGKLNLATREFELIEEFPFYCNHAQFSPVHPNLFLYGEEFMTNPISGQQFRFNNRIWLMNTEGTMREPVNPGKWFGRNSLMTHEFWSGDGKICWVDCKEGAFEMDVETREIIHVWGMPMLHVHCTQDRALWCADRMPGGDGWERCSITLFERKTGKQADIFSDMPEPPFGRSTWHVHPHPQFTPDGKYIVSTTTVREGAVDLAITPVAEAMERL